MPAINGRKRVVITHIAPQVEGGRYPAKAILNKPLTISASIFCDSHESLSACVLVRHASMKQWKQLPMTLSVNDHWEASFVPDRYGQYFFQVEGWIDHFAGWKSGLIKKKGAGQDIAVELMIGVTLVEEAAARAQKSDQAQLNAIAARLRDERETENAYELVTGPELMQLMQRNADRSLAVRTAAQYRVDIERPKAEFSTWYELFPRSAAAEPGKHGTFRDVKRLLPFIAEMGFDVLYLPPIHPIGKVNRKGRNNSLKATEQDPGSPWAIGNELGGHKAIHPELGTLRDFRDLVVSAEKQGIEIAMDIAFQCAPDHPYVREHPQWFKWRPDGTVQYAENPPKKYEDILPLNFECEDWEALWQELKSVVDYWIDKGVRIFRVDNPHTKSFPFWEWLIAGVRSEHPEIIFLAEAFTRPRLMEQLARSGFTQSYTYFTWRNTKEELRTYLEELTTPELSYYFRPNFWPNTPDILPPYLTHGGDNAHVIRLILAATLSSNYGLYGPVYEEGLREPYPGKEEYTDSEKYEIRHWDWHKYTRIRELIARVNRIRKAQPALQETCNIRFAETTSDQIICYVKMAQEAGNHLIVAVNLDPYNTQAAEVVLPLKELGLDSHASYTVCDLLSGDTYRWTGARNYVQLNPHELPAHILELQSNNQTS